MQAPPNLNPKRTELLIRSGVNDFGGVSAVSPDYVNPSHPWPGAESLASESAAQGFRLRPRSPLYERLRGLPEFVDPSLVEGARRVSMRLAAAPSPWMLMKVDGTSGAQTVDDGAASATLGAVAPFHPPSRVEEDPVA